MCVGKMSGVMVNNTAPVVRLCGFEFTDLATFLSVTLGQVTPCVSIKCPQPYTGMVVVMTSLCYCRCY